MILTAEMVYVLMRRGALEYIRNRKTVQITKPQNRNKFRSKSKSEKTCTWLRSLRRIFSEVNLKKHQTASNSKSKTRFYFCRKPKTESAIELKLQTAMVTKIENPKFFWYKSRKTDLKNGRNRKTENPNALLHEEQLRGIDFVTLSQFNTTRFASDKT